MGFYRTYPDGSKHWVDVSPSGGGFVSGSSSGSSSSSSSSSSSTITTYTTLNGTPVNTTSSGKSSGGFGGGFTSGGSSGQSYTTTADTGTGYNPATGSNLPVQTPSQNVMSTANGTQMPQRYKENVGTATLNVVKNLIPFSNSNTYGLIGQRGLGEWSQKTFYDPFEYVGTPKILSKKYVGTPVPGNPYILYRDLQDPKTNWDIQQEKNKALYEETGLKYTGESVSILPIRLGENIASDPTLRTKYQSQVTFETTEDQLKIINDNYNKEINSIYQNKLSNISPKLNEYNLDYQKLIELPANKYIRGTGTAIKFGAEYGAITFGGPAGMLAVGSYEAFNTINKGVKWESNLPFMTTKQKILGAVDFSLTGAMSVTAFGSGYSKLFQNWRIARYEDLLNAPAKTFGKQRLLTDESAKYFTTSIKKLPDIKSYTPQETEVWKTGENRIGFRGEGTNIIVLNDPQYFGKKIVSIERFSTSGYVPDISKTGFKLQGFPKEQWQQIEGISGIGRVKYFTSTYEKNFNLIVASSQRDSSAFNILSARNPKLTQPFYKNYIGQTGKQYRGIISEYGQIKLINNNKSFTNMFRNTKTNLRKYPFDNIRRNYNSNTIQTESLFSEKYQTQFLINNKSFMTAQDIRQLGAASAAGVAKESQPQLIKKLIDMQATKFKPMIVPTNIYIPSQIQLRKLKQLTPTTQLQIPQTKSETKNIIVTPSIVQTFYPFEKNRYASGNAFVTPQATAQSTRERTSNINGIISPPFRPTYTPTQTIGSFDFPFVPPNVSGEFDFKMFTRRFKYKQPKEYSPSYEAFIFNIRGKRPKGLETGARIRPIPKRFSFFKRLKSWRMRI